MAKHSSIQNALDYLHEQVAFDALHHVRFHEKGIGAVLMFLKRSCGDTNSVDISNFLGVSSARVAVIIKKLESKKLIIKSNSKSDARTILINLTELGDKLTSHMQSNLYSAIGQIIDEFGEEEFYALFEKLNKIHSIMNENCLKSMEVLHDQIT